MTITPTTPTTTTTIATYMRVCLFQMNGNEPKMESNSKEGTTLINCYCYYVKIS